MSLTASSKLGPVIDSISHMSHIMRKPPFVIGKQQRRKSACASPQSDQCLLLFAPLIVKFL